MRLAITDDNGKVMLSVASGPDMVRLERELVAPLAKRIAGKLGRVSKRDTWQKMVEQEMVDYFLEIKKLAVYAENLR